MDLTLEARDLAIALGDCLVKARDLAIAFSHQFSPKLGEITVFYALFKNPA